MGYLKFVKDDQKEIEILRGSLLLSTTPSPLSITNIDADVF